MKRLKLVLAIMLLMMALPIWRYLDMTVWLKIGKLYYTAFLFSWSALFLILPISLVFRRFFIPGIILNICFAIIVQIFAPVYSSHSLDEPEARHCSLLNYAGLFYSLKEIMPAAHEDDLLIRNQTCWLKKLEQSIPENLSKHEIPVYQEIIEKKLFRPEVKWKTNLPFLIPIYFHFGDGLVIVEAQKFWNAHYTAEVSSRDYNFLSYPHADYIKWEYGFIEKYLSEFLDELEIDYKYEVIIESSDEDNEVKIEIKEK